MYRVGGSLTEMNMDNNKEPTMSGGLSLSGGGLMDNIMNNISNTPAPKVPIPDNSIKEEVMPDVTDAIIEQARTMDNNSFSASAILNAIFVYIAKLYNFFNVTDKLLPVTRSCENDKHIGSRCKNCWWCYERKWGFGYFESPFEDIN